MKILIITEANQEVASGHLIESVALAYKAIQEKHCVMIALNSNLREEWKTYINNLEVITYGNDLDAGILVIKEYIKKYKFDIIVTDVRQLIESQVSELRLYHTGLIICLDEWGNRKISCDIIINNMMSDYFWNYDASGAKIYCGPEYLMLKSSLQLYHNKEKMISKSVNKVLISMGGVDINNHTLKILKSIMYNSHINVIDVVLGGGYMYEKDIISDFSNDKRIKIHKNIDYIYELFLKDDIAFTAGGNTLYEMAAVGIPCIVVPTMKHEEINGMAFEEKGYGMVVREKELYRLEEKMKMFDYDNRVIMSKNGKKLIDGKGLERVWNIIVNAINNSIK